MNVRRDYLLGTTGNYFSVAASMAVNVVAIPISVRYFGTERYGAMALIMTLLTYLATTSLGVPTAAIVLGAKASAGAERLGVLARAALAVTVLSVLTAAALAVLWTYDPDWVLLLGGIPASSRPEIETAARFTALLFLAGLPLSVLVQGFAASQKVHIERLYSIAGVAAGFACLLATVGLGRDLAAYFAFRGIALLGISVAGALHFLLGSRENRRALRSAASLWPAPPADSELAMSSLFVTSLRLFLMGLAGLLVWNTDNLVISHFFGLGAVTPYAVTFRLITIAFILFTGLNAALAPMYGRASAQGDYAWIHRTYNRVNTLSPMLGGLIWLGAVLFAKPVIEAWVGKAGYGGALMVFALGGYGYCLSLVHSHNTLYTSMNLVENGVAIAWSEGAANLLLSLLLARLLGPAGVALGTFLACLATVFWLIPREIRRRTQGKVWFDGRNSTRHFLAVLLPALILAVFLSQRAARPARLVLGVALLAGYAAASHVALPAELRQWMRRNFRQRSFLNAVHAG